MFAKIKRLNIRNKMLLGYLAPAAIYLGLPVLVLGTADRVFNTFQEREKVEFAIGEASNMSVGAQQMVLGMRGYLVNKNQQFLTDFRTGVELARQSANNVEPKVKNSDQKIRLQKMLELVNAYYNDSNEIVRLFQTNQRAEALALFNTGKYTKFLNEFGEVNREFRETELNTIKQTTQSTKAALSFLVSTLVIGSLLLVLLGATVAWLISSGIAGTIDRAISSIAASSAQIAATVEEQERMASQQAASVNQTTTTMDELGASSRATSQQIETAAFEAMQALNLAGTGTKAVEQTLEAMATLKTKVQDMQGQIMQLSEQTDRIGNISTVVSDLANQTNMLALNAAVEAVRAGEHGKGFGVVASEIRKLADRSKKSAAQINLLVADIQKAINSTVMVTDEGTKTVDSGVNIASETAAAFAGVADAINNVVFSSQQISLNAKQQAIAIEQVVEAMNSLNQAAAQTACGITQTKVGTQKLNEAALDLKAVV
ncbi:methyl-accepting chemotaxis protein [Tychonema sp. LEGE 07203]|uniref:HAMP domain-containing methyl-accepting chemotaxis protein n=1 Tax=Tychonema sp. LEGE 07203 TaxID=1828671 RepID=UPI001881268E|nr:methyl-accepting chemotaxis protein [Tychonema sp. LEGE 07203]MBE9093477.1 methyl-accepting chemotaxis protein [Tychonema sp. LEGE 07203]